jgi:hypothetical protein
VMVSEGRIRVAVTIALSLRRSAIGARRAPVSDSHAEVPP